MSVTLPADKKVMRIALIGVRPADQVILKGYFRVLLRLDTDLEWVSANNPVVDLFMINQDFQNAESVQRLLGQTPRSNVLFITRSPVDMGNLTGNLLTLPLKELEQLSQWLTQNVNILNDNDSLTSRTAHQPASPSAMPVNTGRQTLDEIMAQRGNQANTATNNPIAQPPITPASSHSDTTNAPLTALGQVVQVAQQLQKRQAGLQTLMQGSTILAYIAPDRQRIWLVAPTTDFTQGWSLTATNSQPPMLQESGEDAVQWLWEQAFNANPAFLAQLVRHDAPYHITSWLKPAHGAAQHDVLKIQCVLEAKTATLDETIQTAEVPRELAIRTMAGLIVAGVMPASLYTTLADYLSKNSTAEATPRPTPTMAQPTTDAFNLIDSTILDSLPTSMATPAPQTSAPPSMPAPAPTPTPSQPKDNNMKGFLGRLRSKLGL